MHSLCQQIAGTINSSDFVRFEEVWADSNIRPHIEKNASVVECLRRLVSTPITPVSKLANAAEDAVLAPGFNVVQVRPHGYGYRVKVSSAPAGVAPTEVDMSAQQAQKVLPPEALQAADTQGVATMTDVQGAPDPLAEQPPVPALSFGMYKVQEAGTGKELVGYVIPGLFDPRAGAATENSLFFTGGQYAIQPQVLGKLVGINYDLPKTTNVRGMGVFYKSTGASVLATIPFNIVSEVTMNGEHYFMATDPDSGAPMKVVISDGLKVPVATSPTEVVIPIDYLFLALDNPVALDSGEAAMENAKAASAPTMLEIRAWEDGCDLRGPAVEKIGSGEHSWVDGLFWMAATGIPQNLGIAFLEKAASSHKPLCIYKVCPLSTVDEYAKEASAEAATFLKTLKLPQRVCLLKEATAMTMDKSAAAMVGVSTVDSVLSLNFLNPENISVFVENIPMLEEASTKLAALVLATQLGLQAVPHDAASKAMFSLEKVIEGLKSLRDYGV